MNKPSVSAPVDRCSYHFTDRDGTIETCHVRVGCAVCNHCSRIDGQREKGHCPGHSGLLAHIPVPGQEGERASVSWHAPVAFTPAKRPPRKQRRAGMASTKGA